MQFAWIFLKIFKYYFIQGNLRKAMIFFFKKQQQQFSVKILATSPNLDLLCVWQLDAALFCKNYGKLYFGVKH